MLKMWKDRPHQCSKASDEFDTKNNLNACYQGSEGFVYDILPAKVMHRNNRFGVCMIYGNMKDSTVTNSYEC